MKIDTPVAVLLHADDDAACVHKNDSNYYKNTPFAENFDFGMPTKNILWRRRTGVGFIIFLKKKNI